MGTWADDVITTLVPLSVGRWGLHLRTGCGKTLAFVLPVVERMKAQNFIKTSRKKAPHKPTGTSLDVRWTVSWGC